MRTTTLIFLDAAILAFCAFMLAGATETRWLYGGLGLVTLCELFRDVRDFDEER
jgi:hypothetical protein